MKILKIFGVVVGIHVFALVLIFANPGCSSPNKPAPSPSETVTKTEEPTPATAPRSNSDNVNPVTIAGSDAVVTSVPFDPNAPAGPAIRFTPTRPGTPAATSLESSPVSDVTPASTYTVGKGDSLWTIARKFKISIAEVAAANNIKNTTPVRVGQKLIIPSRTPSMHASTPEPVVSKPASVAVAPAPRASGSGDSVRHVVRPGETLGAIARKYQVKVGEIATANNISDPAKIRPGMELVIPGWQAPGSKSGKAAARTPAASTPAEAPAELPPSTSTAAPSLVLPAPEETTTSPAPTTAEPPVIRVDEKR